MSQQWLLIGNHEPEFYYDLIASMNSEFMLPVSGWIKILTNKSKFNIVNSAGSIPLQLLFR
jgi:hypothetical protein